MLGRMTNMRIAKYYSNSDVRIEETDKPKIGRGELLLRVEASGICGSDVMEWYRKDKVPLVLGHEIAATVAEVGEGVKGYDTGDRVSASHHVPCNECYYCKNGYQTVCETLRKTNFYPGGFSEYVRLPAINVRDGVYRLPENISFDLATFIEPLACVLRAQRIADLSKNQSILVIGSGIAGLLHIHLARASGAGLIVAVDINEHRLSKAKELGADFAVNAKEFTPQGFYQLNKGRFADVVILCTGATSAINQAFESVDLAGTIIFFAPTDKDAAVNLPVNKLFWRTERKIISSYAGSPCDHIEALDWIKSGRLSLEKMITHRLPLKDTALGFKLVSEAKESVKVIIYPQK